MPHARLVDGYVYPIPWIKQHRYSSSRLCERPNYIPHPTPRNANLPQWHDTYLTPLIDINNIICDVMKERYPRNKIKWNSNNEIFRNLSSLIYHSSSKHI